VRRPVAFALTLACAAPLAAQTAPAPTISRADLARSYQRLDRLLASRTLPDDRVGPVHQAFDQSTLRFFAGRYAETLRTLDSLSVALDHSRPAGGRRALLRWRATVDPPRGDASAPRALRVTLTALYDLAEPLPAGAVRLALVSPRGGAVSAAASLPRAARAGDSLVITIPAARSGRIPPGRVAVTLSAGGVTDTVGSWAVAPRALHAARERLLARVAALPPSPARDAVASRVGLLRDAPHPDTTAQALFDPAEYLSTVEREVAALAAGRDPFAARVGDVWRTISVANDRIPVRVVAPGDAGRPLVVAFHGAGIDENGFAEAYGAGTLVRLAAARGVVLALPRTEPFLRAPAAFDTLVAQLVRDHGIDTARVYVLGHSLGAGVATSLAEARPGLIRAAAALFGGGAPRGPGPIAPTLFVAASLDPIATPARIRAAHDAAAARGGAVAWAELPSQGHTLGVTAALGLALDWLLAR
jgi:predicted esterase